MLLYTSKNGNFAVVVCLIPDLVGEFDGELVGILVGLIGLELSAFFLHVVPGLAQVLKKRVSDFACFLEELAVQLSMLCESLVVERLQFVVGKCIFLLDFGVSTVGDALQLGKVSRVGGLRPIELVQFCLGSSQAFPMKSRQLVSDAIDDYRQTGRTLTLS